MKFSNFFPLTVGEEYFNIPPQTINKWIDFVESSPLNPLPHGNDFETQDQDLLDNSIFTKLKQQLIYSAKEYSNNLSIQPQDLQISNSWCYITQKDNIKHNWHTHTNSLITGIFYLTKGAPLYIQNPHQKLWFMDQNNYDYNNSLIYDKFIPEPGKLLLFPSFVPHSIGNNKKSFRRYSIAFNIIPKGEYGNRYNRIIFN
jgi:uncharacterized protein (TIGR02466 family)